ncbi:oxidoreductase [Streptomyces sp. NBC_00669]|uniref:oxidoreductase n=1 Tax=Streptomyces sp. NBC_00669 TaxID=2976011 RepID=UPI002E31DE3F|nr:oxidoreductase [Streptomyces sp. NBC_00669]
MLTYDELTSPERELWDAFAEGRQVDLRPGGGGGEDVGRGDEWGPERTVRAEALTTLLLGRGSGLSGGVAALRLAGARITGALAWEGAEIRHLLHLDGCRLEQRVRLDSASTLAVAVVRSRLPGFSAPSARIGGRLDLRGSVIEGQGRNAVELIHAHVAGGLRLDGAVVSAPDGVAVSAGGIVMDGAVICEDGFRSRGAVMFPGARLSGGLFMGGARLEAPGGVALGADNAQVSAIRCNQGFTADGGVHMRGAQISDLLSFEEAVLGGSPRSLVATGLRVQDLDLRCATPPAGSLDLRGVRATWVQDDPRSWAPEIQLEGFAYDSIRSEPDTVGGRLEWIRRNPGYSPQPYEQLAGHYRRIGHDDEARRTLLAKQRHRRRLLPPWSRFWGYLLDATVGYGYRPWLAGAWLAVLTLLGALVFGTHTPSPDKPGEGPPFNAVVYTLDLLIPIGGFGQRDAWHWTDGALQAATYALIAIGWTLTTAVVAGVTRALSKN